MGNPKSAKPTLNAQPDLASSLYDQLRKIAGGRMQGERGNHILQPTALVHEAYLRLAREHGSVWMDRPRFVALAAKVMRNVLVDYARKNRTNKRGGGAIHVTLDEGLIGKGTDPVDILAIDEALNELNEFDQRQAAVVELHFFGGLTFEEIAEQVGISVRAV